MRDVYSSALGPALMGRGAVVYEQGVRCVDG
jgi:hypothetical protein